MFSSEQVQILYEISMSIGSSLELNQMLKGSLVTILRKLNCSAGAIFSIDVERDPLLQPIMSIPRHIQKNQTFSLAEDYLRSVQRIS